MSWTIEDTILIMAGSGYAYDGLKREGYYVQHPYRGNGLFHRILRELCFRIPFLPKKPWFVRPKRATEIKNIVIWDTLITKDYLNWLKKECPNAKINFTYNNLVTKAKHLMPSQIPEGIRVWTYDCADADKYSINLYSTHPYCTAYLRPLEEPAYDVFFVGRDKGRAEFLLGLERDMKALGLKTDFVIAKDGLLSHNKPYYSKELSYQDMIDHLVRSRAVLNVVMPGQKGITLRDIESVFFGVKLITTNKSIADYGFINRKNVFILGVDKFEDLKEFLKTETEKEDFELLQKHTFSAYLNEITNWTE